MKPPYTFHLQTPRLLLRELRPTDAPQFYALNNDPEVLRYTGDVPFENEAAACTFLEHYAAYDQFGYGRWAVVRHTDGAWLGWCGLSKQSVDAAPDLGFRFFRRYWGQGYATEAAGACLQWARSQSIPRVVGRAMPGNTASVRVLEKVGMSFWKERETEGTRWAIFHTAPG